MFWLSRNNIQIIVTIIFVMNHLQSCYSGVKFVPDDLDIFSECDDVPNAMGIHDILQLDNMNFTISEDKFYVNGSLEILWNIQADDTVSLKMELLKYSRNIWLPTFLTVQADDFCKAMSQSNNYIYTVWARNVIEEDRGCWYKNKIVRHIPFETNISFEGPVNMSGIHKIRFLFKSFDKNLQQTKTTVCADVLGEVLPL